MSINFKSFLLVVFLLSSTLLCSQKVLRLNYSRFGIHHKFDFHRNDIIHYKAFGDYSYKRQKLYDFNENLIYFEQDYGIGFSEIKKIKLYQHSFHNKLFQRVFLIAGIGYFSLYAFNSLILNMQPIVTEQVAWISLSFVAASYLIKQLGIKRIHLNDRNYLKVLDFDFEHLNTP